uniref:Glycine cleavage system H protein n=1 Tax=Chromera velia CCMP2878 TaxID=1169474 RepID=A0A0G4HMZ0_9ALVE|eukprot:Cvel_1172.t1-p1 / transcript=Cvel_1172.t1 / gene=Cvel_1172 / organism=Chromera_velia_CCMP2878 / gene_product=Glycine cleavage system H protein, putative / transcript_product=Glycine cleavage system H protein, putative / location=Cvel_scaffold39:21416-22679(+) / protein_length=150 / sequence_SO=supercontig / SO=protein_coding / is_pseudo=false
MFAVSLVRSSLSSSLRSSLTSAQRRLFSTTYYAKTHEWLKVDKPGEGTLGITSYAKEQLGEVVYVDLPDVGKSVQQKQTLVSIESVKAVGEVYAPVDCEVVAVNDALKDDQAGINDDPEGGGWLAKIKFSGEIEGMLDRAAYDKHLEAEG